MANDQSPKARPSRIPPEVLERLRSVRVPSGFAAAVQGLEPIAGTTPWGGSDADAREDRPIEADGIPEWEEDIEVQAGPETVVNEQEEYLEKWEDDEATIERNGVEEEQEWDDEQEWGDEDEDEGWNSVQNWKKQDEWDDAGDNGNEPPPVRRPPAQTLLDLRFDFRGLSHPVPRLPPHQSGPLHGLVTNTYTAFDGLFYQLDDGDLAPDPVADTTCISCRLVLVWGTSAVPGEGNSVQFINPPIHTAHLAVERFYDAWVRRRKGCLKVLHRKWKSGFGAKEDGYAHRRAPGNWKTMVDSEAVSEFLATDSQGREIDYYSNVLVIHHGENSFRSVDILTWLGNYLPAPVCNLYLWSCYGAAKIHPVKPAVSQIKQGLAKVAGIKGKIRARLAKLDKKIKKYPKNTDIDKWEETADRLRRRLKCECNLCVYTAPYLDATQAKTLIQNSLKGLKGNRKTKAEAALRKLKKAEKAKQKFAVPLSIDDDIKRMVLLAPGREMLRFCFDEKTGKWGLPESQPNISEIFPGLKVQDRPYELREVMRWISKQTPK